MILQHTVFPAKVSRAEAAIPDDPLRAIFAVLERAANLFRWHAPEYRQREV